MKHIAEDRLRKVAIYIKGVGHGNDESPCRYLAAYVCVKCGWLDPNPPRIHDGEYLQHIRSLQEELADVDAMNSRWHAMKALVANVCSILGVPEAAWSPSYDGPAITEGVNEHMSKWSRLRVVHRNTKEQNERSRQRGNNPHFADRQLVEYVDGLFPET